MRSKFIATFLIYLAGFLINNHGKLVLSDTLDFSLNFLVGNFLQTFKNCEVWILGPKYLEDKVFGRKNVHGF